MCHCLLVETEAGLVLVDTGFGERDVAKPKRLGFIFLRISRPALDPSATAARHVEQLGFRREDVRHIVPTHLDLDHAGGIPDFPNATVHLRAAEYDAVMRPSTLLERGRYAIAPRDPSVRYLRYEKQGERWCGFEGVLDLEGLPPEILLVPLRGHTLGHSGVAVRSDRGWLLHAGDAYFCHSEVHGERSVCPVGWRVFQRMLEADRRARLENQHRLRELANEGEVTVVCSHDPSELETLQSRNALGRREVDS